MVTLMNKCMVRGACVALLLFGTVAVAEESAEREMYDVDGVVQIQVEPGSTIEEFRSGGRVYMIKVTPPPPAPPYYLVDERGKGDFIHHNRWDEDLIMPGWVLFRF